ncbi:ribonuclease E inhibitor RraB [Rhizobium sp. BK376]|uniref:ribonuclease E inhibitor RraB n=1 Tax=Rhizobium sp. BK376 TaxID=2512149 RepID=UPI0010D384B3|nr:ribonuclease E inhibitor RraB [Rhizobium sp. BK376]TCR82210.1 regulator of ribonuclease activity B [Rhizobium sp. BK376]
MSLFEENAAILHKFESDGRDLSSPRSIDFCHIFPDKVSADAFARAAETEGFAVAVHDVEREVDPWDVIASKEMILTCEAITDTEEYLDALARSYRGQADGWGFFTV